MLGQIDKRMSICLQIPKLQMKKKKQTYEKHSLVPVRLCVMVNVNSKWWR